MIIKEIFTRKTILTIVITFLLIITSYTALAAPQTQTDSIKTNCLIRITDENPDILVQQLTKQGYDILHDTVTITGVRSNCNTY